MLFDEGRRPTRTEMRRIYDESARQAREFAERLKERLPNRTREEAELKTLPEEPAALPAPAISTQEEEAREEEPGG